MPRRRSSELRVNHERWLVSYADFITLLFAFFVVMYSISQVNESKYRVLSSTLEQAFKPSTRSDQVMPVGRPVLSQNQSPIQLTMARGGNLGVLEQNFRDEFDQLIDQELMRISSNEMWLQIELRDSILFDSASADASAQAKQIFSQVSSILAETDNPIQIEGFTDNMPISTERYPSNWELSAARASAIVKWMVANGVDASRLAAVGYGEHQPAASNDTPDGRAQNRRVAVMIARDKFDRPTNLIDDLAGEALPAQQVEGSVGENRDTADSTDSDQNSGNGGSAIEAVEMEDGDLLFSSDPDLPRQGQ
ncbi:flagellar motor protein MotD [Gilvimarinus sp. SDUM040013]|uniref:Flagellar motor protein MotD n=1 Tax=Gilvimarinus gilvus TaxID=3058038 RepID=A0ABU4RW39_9GAMM|nr:flagellar motor protein MotD [Gilvimarinus sp. SDUM040013]MDO3385036.1 flagellar motor protein MotD [Gilvimarinus sp. SDUM040013]MDX6848411.1 flagellar motor protein MotD [Gilvimarinus sp. SDUM040013]